jgi:hypothetical protein
MASGVARRRFAPLHDLSLPRTHARHDNIVWAWQRSKYQHWHRRLAPETQQRWQRHVSWRQSGAMAKWHGSVAGRWWRHRESVWQPVNNGVGGIGGLAESMAAMSAWQHHRQRSSIRHGETIRNGIGENGGKPAIMAP